jgi:MFS family permease
MRRLLLLGSAVVFLDVVFYTAITPLLPMYADDLGLSKGAAGVLAAAYAAGTLIASLPAGFVAARVGPRRALLWGLLLLGLSSLAFGFSHHVALLDAARLGRCAHLADPVESSRETRLGDRRRPGGRGCRLPVRARGRSLGR